MQLEHNITCPYCGRRHQSRIRISAYSMRYVEQCRDCEGKVQVHVRLDKSGDLDNIEIRQRAH